MANKLVEITISGIKCDNEDCDYHDDSVDRDNYPAYVNKPCPECGANLLTQEDYDTVVLLEKLQVDLDVTIPKDFFGDDDEASFDVEMNGSGTFKLVERKEE